MTSTNIQLRKKLHMPYEIKIDEVLKIIFGRNFFLMNGLQQNHLHHHKCRKKQFQNIHHQYLRFFQ